MVAGPAGGVDTGACPFCAIVAGRLPAEVLFSDGETVAFRDIAPQAPTHVLVVPRRHVTHFGTLGPDDAALVAALVRSAQRVADLEGVAESGYRVVANIGHDAGNSVPHLHLHVLGGRRLTWPPG